jgi:hypothetical protein
MNNFNNNGQWQVKAPNNYSQSPSMTSKNIQMGKLPSLLPHRQHPKAWHAQFSECEQPDGYGEDQ